MPKKFPAREAGHKVLRTATRSKKVKKGKKGKKYKRLSPRNPTNDTKTHVVEAVVWVGPDTVSGTGIDWVVVPRTATQHSATLITSLPDTPIRGCAFIIAMPIIGTPFPYIAYCVI